MITESGSSNSSSTETEEDISNESDNEIEINDKESLFLTTLQEGISRSMGTIWRSKNSCKCTTGCLTKSCKCCKEKEFCTPACKCKCQSLSLNK